MRTAVVAKTLVFNGQGQLLLLKRSANDRYRPSQPDFPGGGTEDFEDITTAAIRETKEEAGLDLNPLDMHFIYTNTEVKYMHEDHGKANVIRVFFATRVNEPVVKLSHEHESFAWLSLDDALALMTHPIHKAVVEHLRSNGLVLQFWQK